MNKIGRIIELKRKANGIETYVVDILTTDLVSVVETLTCIAIVSEHSAGDLVVLVEVQGKYFITGNAGGERMILGQVTSATDEGVLTIALYADGSITEIPIEDQVNGVTISDKDPSEVVLAYSEVQGLTSLAVGRWVKCYKLGGVWYVNNLDWAVPGEDSIGSGQKVDFIVDNFDRADSDSIGAYWGSEGLFSTRGETCISMVGVIEAQTVVTRSASASTTSNLVLLRSRVDASEPYLATQTVSMLHTGGVTSVGSELSLPVDTSDSYSGVGGTLLDLQRSAGLTRASVSQTARSHSYASSASDVNSQYSNVLTSPDHTVKLTFNLAVSEVHDGLGAVDSLVCPVGVVARLNKVSGVDVTSLRFVTYETKTPYAVGAEISTTPLGVSLNAYLHVETLSPFSKEASSSGSLAGTSLHMPDQEAYEATGWSFYAGGVGVSSEPTLGAAVSTSDSDTAEVVLLDETSSISYVQGIYCYAQVNQCNLLATSNYSVSSKHLETPPVSYLSVGSNTLEMRVVGGSVLVRINGSTVLDTTQSYTLSGLGVGIVSTGSLLEKQISLLGKIDDFSGITQFKAWVGDIEPSGSESGHGDIVGGVLEYKDGYHSTDSEGVVTYNPLALD